MENSTRHKVEEASYFLSNMKQTFKDDEYFSYNLSAFLSAARSITFYMQKQYKHKNSFSEWYCQKQIIMSADSELQYLNKARVEDVHKTPVKTGATRIINFTIDAILVERNVKVGGQEEKVEHKSDKKDNVETIRRFFINYEHEDVVSFSERQLKKLDQLVEECENYFK